MKGDPRTSTLGRFGHSAVKLRVISPIYHGARLGRNMKRNPILLFAFPALIIALLAGERVATVSLGTYPASPIAWRIWLELRPLATMFWQQVDLYLGGSMAIDAAILIAACVVLWVAHRTRKSAAFFLANHLALLFAGLMIAVAGHAQTASAIATFAEPSVFPFSLMLDVSWENSLVLVMGLAACAYCHVAFLREARQRAEALAVRLMVLKRDF
ncbi:hypothetical protein [Mesorhizobium sp. M0488]|uniref:hypothetical protein n=1 Tax=unclassified Mesorhizobium TaxID=325217 RepID=UPI003337EEBF